MYAKHVELLGEEGEGYFGSSQEAVLARIPAGVRRALEVGCGAGATLSVLKERGCEVVGVDIETHAIARAQLVLDAAYALDAEEDELPDFEPGYFDLLILSFVLEHVVNPWEFVRRWTRYVRPGGYVLVGVPNIAYYKVLMRAVFRDEFSYEPWGILDWTHLRHYTGKSIEALLGDAGLTILRRDGLSTAVAPSWKARSLARVFPRLMRFVHFAYVILARKDAPVASEYVPFGAPFTLPQPAPGPE